MIPLIIVFKSRSLSKVNKQTEDIDDEESSNEDDFHTGKGDHVSSKVFDSRGTGRLTINRFRDQSSVKLLMIILSL